MWRHVAAQRRRGGVASRPTMLKRCQYSRHENCSNFIEKTFSEIPRNNVLNKDSSMIQRLRNQSSIFNRTLIYLILFLFLNNYLIISYLLLVIFCIELINLVNT